jgi:hypothetical protein
MMKRKILSLFVLVLAAIASQNADAVVMTFDDLPLGHTYNVGDSFIASGIQVQVEKFYPVAGGELSGIALVDNSLYAGGGNGLTLNNVNLKFLLNFDSCPECGSAMLFYDMLGDINLGINGDVRKAADFSDLPTIIDGAQVFVGGSDTYGIIYITGGNIQSFTIGGQALLIDNVLLCGTIVPEPATIVLLGLGSVSVLLRRKKA